jgi:hypothetical protein
MRNLIKNPFSQSRAFPYGSTWKRILGISQICARAHRSYILCLRCIFKFCKINNRIESNCASKQQLLSGFIAVITDCSLSRIKGRHIQPIPAPTNAIFCTLCILLLICGDMCRRSRHPQTAYTNAAKTYINHTVLE